MQCYQLLYVQMRQQMNKCRWTSGKINTTDGFVCLFCFMKALALFKLLLIKLGWRLPTRRHMQLMPIDSWFYWVKHSEGEVMPADTTCHLKVFKKVIFFLKKQKHSLKKLEVVLYTCSSNWKGGPYINMIPQDPQEYHFFWTFPAPAPPFLVFVDFKCSLTIKDCCKKAMKFQIFLWLSLFLFYRSLERTD